MQLRKILTALSPAILLVSVLCGIISAQSGLTTIQDTLFDADGARYNGTLFIQWSTFDTTNPGTIIQQSKTVQVSNGNLLVQLAANNTATPPANIYSVLYQSDGDQQYSETWSVPFSATPLKVTQVRIGTGSGGGSSSGLTGGGATTESGITNLVSDLNARPIKGPGFGTNAVAMVDQNGQIETVVGNAGDCVFVDGTTGPCSSVALPTFVTAEVPGGTIDGNNSMFTLANAPSGTSLLLFRNGLLLQPGADYSVSGSTIQFAATAIPQPQDALAAAYRLDSGLGSGASNGGSAQGSGGTGVNGCGAVGASTKSTAYPIQTSDNGLLLIQTANAGFTLPSPIPAPGWCVVLLDTNAANIAIGNNGLAVNGATTNYTLDSANAVSVISDGFAYWIAGANGAPGPSGPAGATGTTGPAGPTGAVGATGSGAGANNCSITGAVAYYASTGTVVSCVTGMALDSNGNLVSTSGFRSGSSSGNSGYTQWNGAASGGAGIGAAATAGTPVLYLMPATAGTAGQILQDTGATACPSLSTGAPSTCHQMTWASGGAGGYTLISSQTLTSAAATVTFSSVPQTFHNLQLVISGRSAASCSGGDGQFYLQANGDTANNYGTQYMYGQGSVAASVGQQVAAAKPLLGNIPCSDAFANSQGQHVISLTNYAGTSFIKTGTNNGMDFNAAAASGISTYQVSWYWNSTSAITSLLIGFVNGTNFAAGSTFQLYGY
jgi:hypothetical protein